MTDTCPRTEDQAPVDSLKQAGGGAGDTQRTVKTLGPIVTTYLRQIFDTHASQEKTWAKAQAGNFITHVQDNGNTHEASSPAGRFKAHQDPDFNNFLEYMASADSTITLPAPHADLSWPLASYFISSSHNTYLSGNQLSSDSTTASYTNVLLRGCRCVEVDVWDGDDSDSDSDTSSNSSVGRVDPSKADKKKGKQDRVSSAKQKLARLRRNLPDSVASKLDKMKLGSDTAKTEDQKKSPTDGEDPSSSPPVPTPEVGMTEPRVLHGYTLTKEVSFRDVCLAIRESAFTVTDLPLIISLEVHCNPQQQAVMVGIMKETWEGYLISPVDAANDALPSPDKLRNKILVKVKYAAPDSTASDEQSGGDDDRLSPTGKGPKSKNKKPSTIIQELSQLGIYTRAVSFKTWAQPEATMPTHIFSLAENKFLDHQEKQSMSLFTHNRDYLLRAYPSGMRISSSNLNPPVFWGYGAQVVALNWQQTDEGMMLNEGMFAGTGGYVLKPDGYRSTLTSKSSTDIIVHKTLTLHVTFLAAQSLPLPPGDTSPNKFQPYVKVEIHAEASERNPHKRAANGGHGREGEYKARTHTYRGRDIDLRAQRLSFPPIADLVDELTFVRFTVRDDEIGRDDLAAWACVRLDRLGQGYRFIHLLNSRGSLTDGTILVKVEKELKI